MSRLLFELQSCPQHISDYTPVCTFNQSPRESSTFRQRWKKNRVSTQFCVLLSENGSKVHLATPKTEILYEPVRDDSRRMLIHEVERLDRAGSYHGLKVIV